MRRDRAIVVPAAMRCSSSERPLLQRVPIGRTMARDTPGDSGDLSALLAHWSTDFSGESRKEIEWRPF
jgi:hypothetical protein